MTDKERMVCTGGLGLPLAKVLSRLAIAALLACLASLALLAPLALADDLPGADARAASEPSAAAPADDHAPGPPAHSLPDPEPPAAAPAPFVDPTPVVEPPAVELPVGPPVTEPLEPVATIDIPATTDELGEPASAAPVDTRPARGLPADVADAPSQPEPAASAPAPPDEGSPAALEPVAVVIPEPGALAPASWRWPGLATPGSPGAAPVGPTGHFLSSAPPVVAVPSTLPGDGGANAGHRSAERHAPAAVPSQPAPWSPSAPGSPVSAGASPPVGAAGGLGGWALACLLFVLLALAAPRRVLPRPALSPVLIPRAAYAPARAPPAS